MLLRSSQKIHPRSSSTTELFERYAPAVFTFLKKRINSREDAEDMLLEIFTAVLENEQVHDWSDAEQRRWIWRVTRNKMVDAYRKSARVAQIPLEDAFDDIFTDEAHAPEQTALRGEEYTQLRAAIGTLPPLQQQVLTLRFVHEMRSADIAKQVGKSDGAVRVLLSRALNALRRVCSEKI